MSTTSPRVVTCPGCEDSLTISIFESLNGERLPHELDRIRDGTFGAVTCPSCEQTFQIEHEMLLSVLPQRLWVVMYPPPDREGFATLEEELAELFEREFASAPPAVRPLLNQVRPRLVFGQYQLRECLLGHHHQIPPALLECTKLEVQRGQLASLLRYGPVELVFDGLTGRGAELSFAVLLLDSHHVVDQVAVPRTAMAAVAANEDHYRGAYPELFERPWVNASRYLLS